MAPSELSYTVLRSSRKTVSLEIRPDGTILLRAPRRMTDRQIRDFVESKRGWLEARLEKYRSRPALPVLTGAQLQSLAEQAKAVIPARAAHFAPLVGVSYGRITIRAQRTRWGSCSAQGNLNFNCLLMLAPPEVRDYVVIHELCHRKEMNHSDRFWARVESVCPDFRRHRQWLKDNGSALIARQPE